MYSGKTMMCEPNYLRQISVFLKACAMVFALSLGCAAAVGGQPGSLVGADGNFDSNWTFYLGDSPAFSQVSYDDTEWRRLDLPHDFSAEGDFSLTNASGTGFLPGGIGWYRKQFSCPDGWRDGRVTIEFDGVQRDSDVWINGVHLGHRPSGYTGFQYGLTPQLVFGQGSTNIIAVRVDRSNVADSRWYPGTGIYRHVWLRHTGKIHLAPWGITIRTPRIAADSADILTITEVVNGSPQEKDLRVVSRVLDAEGAAVGEADSSQCVAAEETRAFSDWQKIPSPQLWSVDSPVLYTLETRVLEGDAVVGETRTPFGIRRFWFDPDKGFFLNGTNIPIKGFCIHHDGGVVGAAVPVGVLERRLRLAKSIGANAIRCSHNPMAPEFYDLCDRLGLLVMDEAFDEWEIGKRKWVEGRNQGTAERFGYSHAFAEWAEQDLTDMVRQHRNHPSIVLWSLGNEIDYPSDPYVHPESRLDPDFAKFRMDGHPSVTRLSAVAPKLIAAVKRRDPTRPVTMALANVPAANATGLASLLDVAGYNYQEGRYEDDHAAFPERKLIGSENGKRFESWAAVTQHPYIAGLFIWAGFDFLGEAGVWPSHGSGAGLFDRCGFIKPIGLQFEALWKDSPVLHLVTASSSHGGTAWSRRPALHGWNGRDGATRKVTAYTNCKEVELRLNGRSCGSLVPGEDRVVQWEIPFEPGELVAIGKSEYGQTIEDRVVTAGPPARLELVADRTQLEPDGEDVAHVEIRVVDQHGTLVSQASDECSALLSGPAWVGLDNGDQLDPTPLRSLSRKFHLGRALALVRSGRKPGKVTLVITAAGLPAARLELEVR